MNRLLSNVFDFKARRFLFIFSFEIHENFFDFVNNYSWIEFVE